ncbi:hypothetical protein J2Y45_006750 [Dyadobacter sp. BE34]|uniref:Uncharacterized protein n=1 Tax=Dyadobacter fermentans TaxID=94254 RepID=A0ABU1R8F2_9BACT|nr:MULTISPECIES: hypothetical protein [Dyadobacter]MDR6809673.1 hypothetical protein [Dyadobacter fermentans]MDR7047351.1 hypothetical protein [Dyadobacter sp. BE242]MDR7201586.1 hypothetical protein [Dyadobacter sp. BE34]MDR7219456.1 hypothetical protein [Dyadobacter sp. BE31]MDR7267149.1 hypothetical protein [Dyadobacter sp. BE32]
MIIEHPWKTYAIVAILSALVYYTFLGWRFFLPDIKARMKKSKQPAPRHSEAASAPSIPTRAAHHSEDSVPFSVPSQLEDNEPPVWQNEEMFEKAQGLMAHLSSEIKEAQQKGYSKQDLLLMLEMIIKDYSVLKGTAFQTAVNNCIATECAKYGSIHLSEGETIEVWRKVV